MGEGLAGEEGCGADAADRVRNVSEEACGVEFYRSTRHRSRAERSCGGQWQASGPLTRMAWLLVLMGLVLGIAEASGATSCSAGDYLDGGVCLPCAGGWASEGGAVTECREILTGTIENRLETATFANPQLFRLSVGDILTLKISTDVVSVGSVISDLNETKPVLKAAESWGLPPRASFCGGEASATAICGDWENLKVWGMMRFEPNEEQVGSTVSACAEAKIMLKAPHVMRPLNLCVKAEVVHVVPMLSNTSNDTTFRTMDETFAFAGAVGCPIEIPIEVTAPECSVSDCVISRASSPTVCSEKCGGDVALSPTIVGSIPTGSTFGRRELTPGGVTHVAGDRPQYWAFQWVPEHSSESQIPYRVCVSPGQGGTHRCWFVHVDKCQHCVRPGDTMESIAAEHGVGWLQLFFANPWLPSHNPKVLQVGSNLRLGVYYTPRAGDYLDLVADKFLVSRKSILDQNFELWANAPTSYEPRSPGMSAQFTAVFNATRSLHGGETVSFDLYEMSAPDWSGMVASECSRVETSLHYGRFHAAHIRYCTAASKPGEACGPGGWGECVYDSIGKPACNVNQCVGYGADPKLGVAKWSGGNRRLTIEGA